VLGDARMINLILTGLVVSVEEVTKRVCYEALSKKPSMDLCKILSNDNVVARESD
jgi:hypothetical protein